MKAILRTSAILIVTVFSFFISSAQLQKVIIIRHGEKPENGNHLSCQGQNRALQLANVLYTKFKTPDYIYVPAINTGKSTSQARMFETIVPYAIKYNLNVDTKYNVDDAAGVAGAILKRSGTVLVVWEHNNIPKIVQALGVTNEILKWKGDDFDTILIITFSNGKPVLSRDRENINPSTNCQ